MTLPNIVLGFVGIHAGRRTDQPVSQNETLARLFERSGYVVRRTSAVRRPSLRTLHHVWSLLTWPDVDLVVIAVFSGQSFAIADYASLLAAHVRRKKIVFFLHGGNLPVFAPAHERWVRRVMRRADRIFAPSRFLAETFEAWGFSVPIIPNVLAIDNYDLHVRDAARPNILWMRTFHPHYAPVMAVEVLAKVRAVHPDATMTMGGADQGSLDETREAIARLGLDDAVTLAGYLDPEGKRAAFAEADIFLNTNIVDNMPVSVLEAGASGLVPVATSVGGIPDLLTDGVDSLLVPSGDVDAMAAAVIRILDEPETYRGLAAGARRMAEQSAWPAVRARWVEQFKELYPGEDFE